MLSPLLASSTETVIMFGKVSDFVKSFNNISELTSACFENVTCYFKVDLLAFTYLHSLTAIFVYRPTFSLYFPLRKVR